MQQVDEDSAEWGALDDALRGELDLKPWQFPTLGFPDEQNVSNPGSAGFEWFPHAQSLYRQLSERVAKCSRAAAASENLMESHDAEQDAHNV
jgi:hypothetical protein